MSFSLQHAPIRCFFQDIHDRFDSCKPGELDVKFSLLGTVVEINESEMNGATEAALTTVSQCLVKLDDGTAIANVTAKMISHIALQTGSLVECLCSNDAAISTSISIISE